MDTSLDYTYMNITPKPSLHGVFTPAEPLAYEPPVYPQINRPPENLFLPIQLPQPPPPNPVSDDSPIPSLSDGEEPLMQPLINTTFERKKYTNRTFCMRIRAFFCSLIE